VRGAVGNTKEIRTNFLRLPTLPTTLFAPCMTSRAWCFTLNNPSVEDLCLIQTSHPTITFLLAVLERGESETLHYQGYLELDRHRRISHVKTILPRAHLEKRKGKAHQATRYCLKTLTPDQITSLAQQSDLYIQPSEDSMALPPIIMRSTESQTLEKILSSESSKKGTKDSRLEAMKAAIDNNSTDKELADLDFPIYIQHYKGLSHYRLLQSSPRNAPTEVTVIVGPTGTGKSKFCMDNFPGAYWKQRSQWWDGYTNQKTVILDEYYGWLPFDTLLRICDRYPLHVETKGGQVNFTANHIIITSNTPPERWYKNAYFPAFQRRVTDWVAMPQWGSCIHHSDYVDAHAIWMADESLRLM